MRLLRCCLVLLVVTAAATAALRLLLPSVTVHGTGFEGLLVSGCAAAGCGCAVWGWLGAVAVVVEALRLPGPAAPSGPGSGRGVPASVRRLVLAACGVALTTAGPAVAASAGDPQHAAAAVAGLPFPSRAMDLPAESHRVVVVRPGDSLWAIAARCLPPAASDAEITAGWRAIHARNRAVIGDDP